MGKPLELDNQFKVKYLWHIRQRIDDDMEEMIRYLLGKEEVDCNSVLFVAGIFDKFISVVDSALEGLMKTEGDL